MTKREVFKLLKLISIYYDSFDLQQEKVDEWCSVLKGESLSKVGGKLTQACRLFALSTKGFRVILQTGKWC